MNSARVQVIRVLPTLMLALGAFPAAAQKPTLPSETPATFTPARSSFDYDRRDVMIAMRDGAKLHTVILVPKGARRAPILLTRTPYDASATTTYAQSAHLGPTLNGYDNALDVIIPGGYIRVVQDVRGKYGSEGDYVMNRPLVGPLNPTTVDESTDTYDTIDWLVKNPKQDIFRAMRLVRSLANDFNVDTSRIGVMGFSAGGEVAGWVSYHFTDKHFTTADAVDKLNARPAFQVLIYPGPLAVPDSIPSTSPPSFLLAANDDECCSEPIVKLLEMHRKAKVPVEVHLYAQGNHAFNMGNRSSLNSIKTWSQRLADWLKDNNWLIKK